MVDVFKAALQLSNIAALVPILTAQKLVEGTERERLEQEREDEEMAALPPQARKVMQVTGMMNSERRISLLQETERAAQSITEERLAKEKMRQDNAAEKRINEEKRKDEMRKRELLKEAHEEEEREKEAEVILANERAQKHEHAVEKKEVHYTLHTLHVYLHTTYYHHTVDQETGNSLEKEAARSSIRC